MAKKSGKLLSFHWRGFTARGAQVKGQLLAYSEQDARHALSEQAIRLEKIKARAPSSWIKHLHAATPKDITLFSRQIATMLDAGVPLGDTLTLLKESAKKPE